MVLAYSKDRMVPPEKYLKCIHELLLHFCSLLSYFSSECPFILRGPALLKKPEKMNHEVANSHIRRKICLEKAWGKSTHTCVRSDTGKQRREHRKETLWLGTWLGRSAGSTKPRKSQRCCEPGALRLPLWGPCSFLGSKWVLRFKWLIGFFPSHLLELLSTNHRTRQNTLLESV